MKKLLPWTVLLCSTLTFTGLTACGGDKEDDDGENPTGGTTGDGDGGAGAQNGDGDDDCTIGEERCECYGNNSCNDSLSCLSGICVDTDTNTGGSDAGTGGADNGTGGSDNGTGGSDAGPTNLVKNGSFDDDSLYWNLDLQGSGNGSYSDSNGELCIYNDSSISLLSVTVGYPSSPTDSFAVEAGSPYTLSYRLRGSADLEVKVGQAVSPWGTIQTFNETISSAVMQSKSHNVTPASAESQAGLAFNFVLDALAEICFDDISFVAQ